MMPVDDHPDQAEARPLSKISKIWLLPILAVLIGGWMLYFNWSTRGQLISIEFENAAGLEAGVTKIKTRNVDIGIVNSIRLSENSKGVIVTARLAQTARKLLRIDTQFWIVSPKIDKTGISELPTLLSGSYIKLAPGIEEEYADSFIGLQSAPVTPAGVPGLHVTLNSHKTFAFSAGDPIFYHDLMVGTIESVYFNLEERIVYYNAFIKEPYHQLITTNTRFWRLSSLQLDLSANGISAQIGSIESLLRGGLTFDVDELSPMGEQITQRAYFTIYPDKKTAFQSHYQYSTKIVLLIPDSVRGLTVDAPVEYKGITIGRVLQINPREINHKPIDHGQSKVKNFLDRDSTVPVLISIDPGQLGLDDTKLGAEQVEHDLKKRIKKGLKASLKSGNLLTGSQLITLNYQPESGMNKVTYFDKWPVIPYVADGFSRLGDQASELLAQLNQIPWQKISTNTNNLLVEATGMANKLSLASQSLETLLATSSRQQLPENFNKTLIQLDKLAKNFSQGSRSYEDINSTLNSMNILMKELTPLVQQLRDKPNSLIFGGSVDHDMEPEKHTSGDRE
ncbi:MAG: intermembrane transport protein PqiB [Gammaproteobacteria bacterium]|nr:intermembrane transport protein PqiB [Gammaproteobacteria bacterium]